jgi:TPR repeat protein
VRPRQFGLPDDAPERVQASITYTLSKAAEQGHTKAMLNLGALYEQQARSTGSAAAPQVASPAAAPTAIPLSAPTAPVATPLQ